jgi:hypothetical protein
MQEARGSSKVCKRPSICLYRVQSSVVTGFSIASKVCERPSICRRTKLKHLYQYEH